MFFCIVRLGRDWLSCLWSNLCSFEVCIISRGVPNSGFRLLSRIRIVLWTIWPNKDTNTNRVADWAFWCCTCCSDICHLLMSLANYGCACKLSSHGPLPFIRLIVSQNQAVWARAAGTDWVKSAVDITIALYMYRLSIRIRSDDTICPNTNTLFGPLFGFEANTKWRFGTFLIIRSQQSYSVKICISVSNYAYFMTAKIILAVHKKCCCFLGCEVF